MNKYTFSKILPILSLLLATGVLVVGVMVIYPNYKKLMAVKSQIEQSELEIRQEEEYFKKLAEIKEELDQDKENILKIGASLPNNPGMPAFLNFLQKTADRAGVTVSNISPFTVGAASINSSFNEVKMSLTVMGSYQSFKEFLSFLEKSSRMVEVETVSFSADPKDSASSFNLSIKIYSY